MGRFSYWIKIFDRLLMFQPYFPGLMKQSRSSTRRHMYLIQTYQIYFIKIYIWKRRKPESAKHRRIFMPIWFAYLTILPGSAAGAAALIYTVAPNVHISEEHDFTTWRQHLPDERRRRFPVDGCHLLEEGHLQQLICHLTMLDEIPAAVCAKQPKTYENLSWIASKRVAKKTAETYITVFSPSMNEFQVDPEAVKHTWNILGISSEEAKHSNIQCRAP